MINMWDFPSKGKDYGNDLVWFDQKRDCSGSPRQRFSCGFLSIIQYNVIQRDLQIVKRTINFDNLLFIDFLIYL